MLLLIYRISMLKKKTDTDKLACKTETDSQTYMWYLKRNDTNELIYKTETDSQT